jgi:hypothetical protein
MKPVLKESEQIYYVTEAEMVEFISKNAPMDWNDCCDFVRDNDITSSDGNVIYWDKEDLTDPEMYNPEQVKWIEAFFDAHPWITKMMIVFDN